MIEPYGNWKSPITAEMTAQAQKSPRSTNIVVDGQDVLWTESRPFEKGRTVIMKWNAVQGLKEITPVPFDVRSKVHEYGGLAFTAHQGTLYFINAKDQRLYMQKENEEPRPISKEGIRLAEPLFTSQGIVCIAEIHSNKEVENFLALINPVTQEVTPLAKGADFYAAPALHPEGKKLAWLTWNHPQMPWDGTELWIADFEKGQLNNQEQVAGGKEESIFQPQWSPEGILTYVSDKSGWWNLYQRHPEKQPQSLCPLAAEFGLPLWGLGISTWRFTGNGEEIICTYVQEGIGKMALLDPLTQKLTPIKLSGTDFSQIATGKGFAVFMEGSVDAPRRVVKLDLKSLIPSPLDPPPKIPVEKEFLSKAEPISFPTANGKRAFGIFYPPTNPTVKAPQGSLPPLLVMSHGGPTAATDPVFNLRIHYWTSRGWAVLDVNYGGSTGYGREYRERLKGEWGIVDVQDCSNGALYLASLKKVDPKKLVIRGFSAGGYTTLAALTFTETFATGASYYGVADLALLAQDTHKFEARYLDKLVAPYPEGSAIYTARSPLQNADRMKCPVIFFQGGKDKVVPPNQAETLYGALKKRGIKTELVIYPEEEHGFRSAATLQDCLEKELKFYLDVLS